ncbi:hypothetical protein FRC01_010285 [Tulasnella sp. 417]|nr:hypothetical protein FRC01_010285 [Tulasnella sp. 417]
MFGVALVNCDPDGIGFLFEILKDVEDVLAEVGSTSNKMREINMVKAVLSGALERHGRSGHGRSTYESLDPPERECGATGDSDRSNGGSRVEEWDFDRLCKWILNQVQENGLEKNENCRRIIAKLETRCEIVDPKTTMAPSSQSQRDEVSQGEATQEDHSQSPISLLPVEILQHIFWLAASPHLWIRAPLVLSLVNSHFRTIVLDTPSLWTTIDDSLPRPILQLYWARSKKEPLDVLTRADRLPKGSTCSHNDWLDFLNMESARIVHMAIAGNDPGILKDWGLRIRRDEGWIFKSLTKLAIRLINGAHDRTLCPRWDPFPNLRELWIQGCWCRGWVGPDDPFPPTLRQLRLSNTRGVSLSILIDALEGVLGLVGLAIEDISLDSDEVVDLLGSPSRVTLEFLEKLEFADVSFGDIRDILRYVSTPNLSSFSITTSGPSVEITEFLEDLAVGHPRLSFLRIVGFNVDWGRLKGSLHSLATLTHLDIRTSDLSNDGLALLKDGAVSPVVLS